MNSIITGSRLAVVALLGGMVLAGCKVAEDVRSEPATPLPKQLVVLEGKVYGLGIRRSIGLQNGAGTTAPSRLVAAVLGEPMGTRGRETRFFFGSLEDGASYDIRITPGTVPFGKLCTVNNGAGVLHYSATDEHHGAPQNIEVVCTDDLTVARYDIRVATPDPFRSAAGAKVTLMTEEGVYEADPKDATDGDPNFVWFRKKLITVPASGVLPFQNIIKAYTTEGSTSSLKLVNRCAVTNQTFASPAGTGADVTNVSVGLCKFSVGGADTASGGAVRYSRPATFIASTTDPVMGAGGVTLELRYPDGRPVPGTSTPTTEVTINSFGGSFTFPTQVTSGAECPPPSEGTAPIPCEVRGFYEVVVKSHPAGQRCIVASTTVGLTGPLITGAPTVGVASTNNANTNLAGAANLFLLDESAATGTFPFSPGDYTGLRVYCRNLPAGGRVLTGTYQVTNMTVFAGSTITSTLAWSPAYTSRRLYSNMLTLFPDGTFLFGAHTAADAPNTTGITNHAEQGFYDYEPNTTIPSNGNTVAGNKLRFTVHVDGNTGAAVAELAAGISSAEGPRTGGAAATGISHRIMTNVVIGAGNPRTITGRFGPDGSPATTAARDIVFTEPESINGQMTGSWVTQDRNRFWSWNFDTTYGFHAGVTGFPNIQDNCFKIPDATVSTGTYIPSSGGGQVYCNPVGSAFQSNLSSLAHSPPALLQNRLPGWQGWMPGAELGGGSTSRSPSVVQFHIAAPGNFFTGTDPAIFPPGSMTSQTWCTTEIMGVRSTLNGVPDRNPVYFCRIRAN